MERLCVPPQGAQVSQGTKFPDQGTEFNHPSITCLHTYICKKKILLMHTRRCVQMFREQLFVIAKKKKKNTTGEKMTMMRRMDRCCSFTMKQHRAGEVNELSYMPQLGCFINAK